MFFGSPAAGLRFSLFISPPFLSVTGREQTPNQPCSERAKAAKAKEQSVPLHDVSSMFVVPCVYLLISLLLLLLPPLHLLPPRLPHPLRLELLAQVLLLVDAASPLGPADEGQER